MKGQLHSDIRLICSVCFATSQWLQLSATQVILTSLIDRLNKSLPKYVKCSVTSTACSWMCIGGGAKPQPTFCSFVFIHDVHRLIVSAASLKLKPVSILCHWAEHLVNRTVLSSLSWSVSHDMSVVIRIVFSHWDMIRSLAVQNSDGAGIQPWSMPNLVAKDCDSCPPT